MRTRLACSRVVCTKTNIYFLEVDDWKHSYMLPFQTYIDTNLIYFQYIILHRILTTNRFLFIVMIADNDLCSFCNNASESIVHLFVQCQFVEDVWHAWLVKNHIWVILSTRVNLGKLGKLGYIGNLCNFGNHGKLYTFGNLSDLGNLINLGNNLFDEISVTIVRHTPTL
jgi:hypothetical protein